MSNNEDQSIWLVGVVTSERPLQLESPMTGIFSVDVPLVWSDGMVGVVPVFRTKEDAERYADGKVPVWEGGVRAMPVLEGAAPEDIAEGE